MPTHLTVSGLAYLLLQREWQKATGVPARLRGLKYNTISTLFIPLSNRASCMVEPVEVIASSWWLGEHGNLSAYCLNRQRVQVQLAKMEVPSMTTKRDINVTVNGQKYQST